MATRERLRTCSIVLDDDPTGSQTVYDVNAAFSVQDLNIKATLGADRRAFVLTNTRSLDPDQAGDITRRAVDAAYSGLAAGDYLQVISRSDSTLRGHVHREIGELQQARRRHLGSGYDAILFAPSYPEAGRVTVSGRHYVAVGREIIPVGETEFARDAAFGYRASALSDFLIETSRGEVREQDILPIGLDDIRLGGPQRVRELLCAAEGRWAVADSLDVRDVEIVALGTIHAAEAGIDTLVRCGPSLVRPLLGVTGSRLYRPGPADAVGAAAAAGLVVVGSFTDRTNRQLEVLTRNRAVSLVELSVPAVLAGDSAALARTRDELTAALECGPTVLVTSRSVASLAGPGASLEAARSVSAAVAATVRETVARRMPRWVISKGGITSHDVTVSGLGISRARVLGQLLPGQISVFRALPGEAGYLRDFVVFPGNVGAEDALLQAVSIMEGECT
jgi:uncharacterized protein YgbK (DUF1537 family)